MLHILHTLTLALPEKWIRSKLILEERVLLHQSVSGGAANAKRAAAFKMNEMMKNALVIAEHKVR